MEPIGAKLLYLIRQQGASDYITLRRGLGVRGPTGMCRVSEALEKLFEAGLIEGEGAFDSFGYNFPTERIRLTPHAIRVQQAIGFSLHQVAHFSSSDSIVVRPLFGVLEGPERERVDLFTLMPFVDTFLPVYQDHIRKVAGKMSLNVKRADDFFGAHEIMKDIWLSLQGAGAVIADCTGRNPNVFYEIGIAHTLGKPVILMTQDEGDVPFDVRAIRFIKYSMTPRGMKKFESTLEATLREILSSNSESGWR